MGTTTKEIASKAGISEVTLFRYFNTKESLFEAVLVKKSILEDLDKLGKNMKEMPLEELLEYLTFRAYQLMRDKKKFIKIILSEIHGYPVKVISAYENFTKKLNEGFEKAFSPYKEDLKMELPLKVVAQFFLGAIFSYFLMSEVFLNREVKEDILKKELGTFVSILLEGLKGGKDAKIS